MKLRFLPFSCHVKTAQYHTELTSRQVELAFSDQLGPDPPRSLGVPLPRCRPRLLSGCVHFDGASSITGVCNWPGTDFRRSMFVMALAVADSNVLSIISYRSMAF